MRYVSVAVVSAHQLPAVIDQWQAALLVLFQQLLCGLGTGAGRGGHHITAYSNNREKKHCASNISNRRVSWYTADA